MEPRQERRGDPMPRDVMLVLRIVHAAMSASILVYAGVMAMVTRPQPVDSLFVPATATRTVPPQSFTVAMVAAATASLVAILLVSRRIAGGRAFTMAILCWALAESIAIYGLVLGMVQRDMAYFLPFAGVSLLAMIFLAPRKSWVSRPNTGLEREPGHHP